MKKFITAVQAALMAAARARARQIMLTQEQFVRPYKDEHRANAGGWN